MVPRVSAAYYEVKESPLYWGIEYQGKYYEWVRNITFDFKQAPGFGHDVTMNNIPTGKESLFSGYEFLCSGLAYPPDQTTVSISGKTSLTVKPTKEQSGIIARFYYIKHELPDFAVTKLTPGTEKTEPGKTYTGKATFALKGNPGSSTAKIPAEITITHNGYSVIAETKEFTPGLPQEISFNWTGQTSDSILRAEIWPTEPANQDKAQRDANPEDNVIEAKIPRVGYKLTVMKSGEGAITPSEGEHFYPANEKVNLIAVPDPGWKFVRWENDVSGTNPSTQVVMDKDKKVKAVFEKNIKVEIIILPSKQFGDTTPLPAGVHELALNEIPNNLTAVPNEPFKFVRWEGHVSGTSATVAIPKNKDHVKIIAVFELDQLPPPPPVPGPGEGMMPPGPPTKKE